MIEPLYLGIDVGTARAGIFDGSGKLLALAQEADLSTVARLTGGVHVVPEFLGDRAPFAGRSRQPCGRF